MENYSPFSSRVEEQVASLSETALISRIRDWLGDACPEAPEGIGDDCAVRKIDFSGKYLLTTVDGVGWGKHFDDQVSPEMAGRKLLARNLSDIASMGGQPLQAVVSLWLAPQVSLTWLQRFYEGLAELALAYEVAIVGGDVSSAAEGVMIADLCLQGICEQPLLRGQVATDDSLWVTGELGGSRSGKHVAFEPRLNEGQWLQSSGWAKSMIDVSDGLAKDLSSLVGGYNVRMRPLPISKSAYELARSTGYSPMHHAINDGEDYELLFAVDAARSSEQLLSEWKQRFGTPLTQIGVVESRTDDGSFRWTDENGEPMEAGRGYEHF